MIAGLALFALSPSAARADGTPAPSTAPAPSTTTALVEDEFGIVMTVREPTFYRPASGLSLGGGGKGTKVKELRVWNGAHELLVPLDKLTRVDIFGKCDQDLLQVRLTLLGGKQLEGKIERDLELRGSVDLFQYEIKFERVRSVTIRTSQR